MVNFIAQHADNNEPYVVSGGWAFPDGEDRPTEDPPEIAGGPWPVMGIWKHFKGGSYRTMGGVYMRGTLERLVVYESLDGEPKVWVRPVTQWSEEVLREGEVVPRFTLLGA